MKQQVVIYDGKVDVLEYPCVVFRKDVLIKPTYVYIGEIERYIVSGSIPVKIPVVLGSTGVARVIESYKPENAQTGRFVTISPFGNEGILGLETNGILSNYASIDHSYIDDHIVDPEPVHSLRPLIKHAYHIAKHVLEPVLIEGCGLIGLATGLILRELGIEPLYYCEHGFRRATSLGLNVEKHISELSGRWGSIVITSIDASPRYRLLKTQMYRRIIVSRLAFMNTIPVTHENRSFEVIVADGGDQLNVEMLHKVENILARYVKVINISKLEETLGMFPPKSLGIILSINT